MPDSANLYCNKEYNIKTVVNAVFFFFFANNEQVFRISECPLLEIKRMLHIYILSIQIILDFYIICKKFLICSFSRQHMKFSGNQLLQLCTARTAWSDTVVSPFRSASVIKLVSVFFGKCTILVVSKC